MSGAKEAITNELKKWIATREAAREALVKFEPGAFFKLQQKSGGAVDLILSEGMKNSILTALGEEIAGYSDAVERLKNGEPIP